jgi:protocatechuate 3,4-dioxygenase beta subunit
VDGSAAPILQGRVTDEKGTPIPDVDIILFGGLATRWKVASAKTDSNGEYKFDPCRYGAMVVDEDERRWDYYIGMTLSHHKFASADGNSWWDVRVPQIDRHVVHKDFVMTLGGTLSGTVTGPGEQPANELDLRIRPAAPGNETSKYWRYAKTNANGDFKEAGLYPRAYDIQVNSPEFGYPVIGRAEVKASLTTEVDLTFSVKESDSD